MCRICTYYGKKDSNIIKESVESLLKISKHDVIGVLSGIDDYHPDGWGVYIRGDRRETYVRSGNPVFEEEKTLRETVESSIHDLDRFLMILHIRAASQGEPHGPEHSHPYMITNGELKVILAHNGAVKKREILEDLRMEYLHNYITDSMALTMYIFNSVKRGLSIEEIISNIIEKYVKTALMTSILIVSRDCRKLVITSHVSERARHRVDYYRLYKIQGPDFVMYMSSSIAHEMSSHGTISRTLNIVPLPVKDYYEILDINV